MKKIFKIIFITLLIIIIFLFIYLEIVSIPFNLSSEKVFILPGISDGFIQQGIDYNNGYYYISGYMNDQSPSSIYIISEKTKKSKRIFLKVNNKNYIGHAGGIAISNKFVYVAGDEKGVIIYNKKDIINAKNNSSVNAVGIFNLNKKGEKFNVAFLTISNNQLIIGEFYRKGNYETKKSHQIITPSNDKNKALAISFNLDDNKKYGIGKLNQAYSIPKKIQGMAIDDKNIYLSSSYAISPSKIHKYNKKKITQETITLYNKKIPLYYLDSTSLSTKKIISPMSEEILIKDNYLYIVNESASKKYIFGNLTGGKYCYRIKLAHIN